MGIHHSITVENVATGASANTFTSLLGIIAANTTGHRGRLRKLKVTPSGEAAQDVNVSIRVTKTDNTSAGTGTAVTPKKKDAGSVASVMTAKKAYTVEPTTVDTEHFISEAINGRGGFSESWTEDEAPKWGINQTLLIQGAPGTAAAVKCTITAEWEEY